MRHNPERNAEIIRRIKVGQAFPDIASEMAISKNAVIGVCFRAGLSDPKRHAAAVKANWQDPEFRERNAAAVKANWQDPEFRERHAAATKANWQDPEFRERNAAATKAGKAQILCDRYGLRPTELDQYREIRRRGFKPAEAAKIVINSRRDAA